jgi:hypothetical protein
MYIYVLYNMEFEDSQMDCINILRHTENSEFITLKLIAINQLLHLCYMMRKEKYFIKWSTF